jgi:hypothetical protein
MHDKFIIKYLAKSNRQSEASWSSVYIRMSGMGVLSNMHTQQTLQNDQKIKGRCNLHQGHDLGIVVVPVPVYG